jgi:putative ABC transport system permease protein
MLTVFLHSWITGVMQDGIEFNARFNTGHVKIMTQAYAHDKDQIPNDLALTGTSELMDNLKMEYPGLSWAERIRFGGLIDVSGSSGVTRAQGPAIGLAIDLLSGNPEEINRLNLATSLKKGQLPRKAGEILISDEFSEKLKVKPGDMVTLIGSTMNGAMAIYNFKVAGNVVFGTAAMDRGTIITDIRDAQSALDMNNASSEIVGYFMEGYYNDELAKQIRNRFNSQWTKPKEEFSPAMYTLKETDQMSSMIDFSEKFSGLLIAVFVLAMSVVLWNAGLLGGLRRYGEFGLRLAMGETQGHIYRTQIYESIIIGILGTFGGTILGLGIAWLFQEYGIDGSKIMKNAAVMMPSSFHARITPVAFYIGFIPGLISTVLGTMLSGLGIYKRKTSQLFKELDT